MAGPDTTQTTMKNLLLILLILSLPQWVSAQVVQVQQKICKPLGCITGTGSGVVIGRETLPTGANQYYVLTVAHNAGVYANTRYNPLENYGLSVVTKSGPHPAKIVQCDGSKFLMLLSFVETTGERIPVLPIANQVPNAGDAVTIHGFSARRNCQYGVRSLTLRSFGPTEFTVNSPFEQGESGGPILDKSGQILGLCEGHDVRKRFIPWGPSAVAIRAFLDLPAIGADASGTQTALGTETALGGQSAGGVPMRPAVSLPAAGSVVPVPPPPVDPLRVDSSRNDTGKDESTRPDPVPIVAPPVPVPVAIADAGSDAVPVPGRILPEPDAISNPRASPFPALTQEAAKVQAVVPTLAKVADTGLNLWSLLAGAGLVAGTGGVGGLALLAWKGLKAARAAQSLIASGPIHQPVPPVAPVIQQAPRPVVFNQMSSRWNGLLPPHDITFVDVPNDFRKASVDWALAELGKPGSTHRVAAEKFKSLINQHLAATGHSSPEELH